MYFYVLGNSVTFPDYGEVALSRRCPVMHRSSSPSGHQSLRGTPYISCMGLDVVAGPTTLCVLVSGSDFSLASKSCSQGGY